MAWPYICTGVVMDVTYLNPPQATGFLIHVVRRGFSLALAERICVIIRSMWDFGLHSRHFGGRTLTVDRVAGSSPETSDWVKHDECSSIGAK